MKKYIVSVLAALMVVGLTFGQNLGRVPGIIFAGDRGDRSSTTLNTIITALGNRSKTVVLDGGPWVITANVTFPTNLAVVVLPGAYMAVSAGYVVTIDGPLIAGDYRIFSGAGQASGNADFTHRFVSWGSTNLFDVGVGKVAVTADIPTLWMDAPSSRSLNTTYTNTADAGGFVSFTATSIDGTSPTGYVRIVTSDLTTTTILAQVSSQSTNDIISGFCPVPDNYLYRVVMAPATATGTVYFTQMLHQ